MKDKQEAMRILDDMNLEEEINERIILSRNTTDYVKKLAKEKGRFFNCVVLDASKLGGDYDLAGLADSIRKVSRRDSWAIVACDLRRAKKTKEGIFWQPMDVVVEFLRKNWTLSNSVAVSSKIPQRRSGRFGSSLVFLFIFKYSSDSLFLDEHEESCSDFLPSDVLLGSDKFGPTISPGVAEEVFRSVVSETEKVLVLMPRDVNFLLACKNSGVDYTVVTESEKIFSNLLFEDRQKTIREGILDQKGQIEL